MDKFNFNNKKFVLVKNSDNGQVDTETVFEYKQEGNLVTADYFGGSIKYGKIVARLEGDRLNMLYQCLTTDNQLKAGKAIAQITLSAQNKIKLSLDWEWLTNGTGRGKSEYLEL
jgi:hypothetical protein